MRGSMATLLLLTCCGCRHFVERHELPNRPNDEDVRNLTVTWAGVKLKDPGSARYRNFSDPRPGYSRGPFMTVGLPGWVWSASIMASRRSRS